jgi:transmembrane protein EpsG
MFYLAIFILILFFAHFEVRWRYSVPSSNLITYSFFLIFWLVAGLRFETGVDWLYYKNFFQRVEPIGEVLSGHSYQFSETRFEIGFKILNSLVKSFTDDVQWLFIIIAFITNILLFLSLRRYSNYLYISLLIYFCSIYFILDMSGIRHCISLNIFLYSIQFLVKKQPYKFFSLILMASLFHITALILFPLYFILKTELKTKTIIVFSLIGLLISVVEIRWLKEVINLFFTYFNFGLLSDKLYFYTAYEIYASDKPFGIGMVVNFLILIFILMNRKNLQKNKLFNAFLNLYLISLFFYYYTWELTELSTRVRLYFLVGNAVLFTYLIDLYKDKLKRYLVFSFIVAFSFFYARVYLLQMPIAIAHNPYQNYVIHKVLDIQGTGYERLQKHKANFKANTMKKK